MGRVVRSKEIACVRDAQPVVLARLWYSGISYRDVLGRVRRRFCTPEFINIRPYQSLFYALS